MTGLASNAELRMSLLRIALFTVPGVLLLGILSGRLANAGYGNAWFDALVKPAFMPPGWLFGAAWTCLYILLGLAFAMLLHARGARQRDKLITLFVLQLALNYAWSPVFFGLHRISLAASIIAAMIVMTGVLIAMLWRVRPLASALLLPYLGWLMFATALNVEILRLNPGADGVAAPRSGTDIRL